MTKTELSEALAEKADLSQRKAKSIIDNLTETITEKLTNGDGEKVTIQGFGTFDISHRESRQGVDPRDHDKRITIPARTVPRFRPGSTLKKAVREAHDGQA